MLTLGCGFALDRKSFASIHTSEASAVSFIFTNDTDLEKRLVDHFITAALSIALIRHLI